MRVVLHPSAQREFDEKITYLLRHGLVPNAAELFIDEIEQAIAQIEKAPGKRRLSGRPGYYRVGPTKRFSYSLIYQISGDLIEVLAVAAPQRRPAYWRKRRF
jgi:plasmid stabilization system protein ParE